MNARSSTSNAVKLLMMNNLIKCLSTYFQVTNTPTDTPNMAPVAIQPPTLK
jgi:hypothetical protein